MRSLLVSLFFVSLFLPSLAQTPTLQWVRSYGSTANDYGIAIDFDNAGNSITAGAFGETIDFDPGPAVYNLTSNGHFDLFILKLDVAGNFMWAKNLGGSFADMPSCVKLDNNNNIYVSGSFAGTVDFDPGPAVFNMSETGGQSFVMKLDASGNFLWARQFMQTNITAIAPDMFGRLYCTGEFYGLVDFDPGPNFFTMTERTTPGSPNTMFDVFVLKLNAAGEFMAVEQIGGVGHEDAKAIGVDPDGNVIVTGNFNGTPDVDPGPGLFTLTTTSNSDVFIVKLNTSGVLQWAKQTVSQSQTGATVWDLGIDGVGNVCIGGVFSGSVDFDPGAGFYNLSGTGDAFILKLYLDGSFTWAKQIEGTGTLLRALTMDPSGNVYFAGAFSGSKDFDPAPGSVYVLNSNGFRDIYNAKLDINGNFKWANAMGSDINYDDAFDIQVDPSKNVYTIGFYWGTVDFDPGPATHNVTMVGTGDAFIQKLSQCANVSTNTITASACNSFTFNNQTYTLSGSYTQILTNALNCDSIITLNLSIGGSTTNLAASACDSYFWEGQTYTASGIYTVNYLDGNGCDSIRRLSLQIRNKVITNITISICEGQSYGGYTTPGIFTDTFLAANGCDSIRTLNLSVKPSALSSVVMSICDGESYAGYTTSGIFADHFIAANGCDSTRTLYLTVHPKKITNLTVDICEGESYFVAGAAQTTTGIYNDTLQTVFGCDSIITTHLSVYQKPQPNMGADRSLCAGTTAVISPGLFASYLWQDGSAGNNFTVSTAGLYWVKVTDDHNCVASDSVRVVSILPSPTDFLKKADSICSYQKLEVEPSRSYSSYLWSTGTIDKKVTLTTAGVYWLTVRDSNGCTGTDTLQVFKKDCMSGVYFPSAFTPNKDGSNDIFKALVFGDLLSFRLEIFDRGGKRIFHSTDAGKGWDGIYKDIPYSTAAFVWQCSYLLRGSLPQHEKGTIMVIR